MSLRVILEGLPKHLKRKCEVIQAEKGRCVPGKGRGRTEGMKLHKNVRRPAVWTVDWLERAEGGSEEMKLGREVSTAS